MLYTALSTIVVLAVLHVAAFMVVKYLYPPAPVVAPAPAPPPVFTQPAVTEQQHAVVLPTYEAPVPSETKREEGRPAGPPPPESTAVLREPRVDPANAQ